MVPSREVFWNIDYHSLLYPFLLITLIIFGVGLYRRIRLWRLGQSEKRNDHLLQRILAVLKYGIAQVKVLKETYPGVMHMLVFLGFVILLIGTTIVSIDYDVWYLIFGQESFLTGSFYLYFSLILDIAGVIALAGILIALFRRYIQKPDRLNNQMDDAVFLIGLLLIITGGYFVEASRIAAKLVALQPVWPRWSPVGSWLSGLFAGLATEQIEGWHKFFWWSHLILAFAFIAYIPFSKLFHMISSHVNIFFRSFKPKGELQSIDIENAESFGTTRIDEFTWKHLMDLDACTRCGRCQDQCPAYVSEKPLSPKKLILDLLDDLNENGPKLLKTKGDANNEPGAPLVGTAVTADEIWACTTCRACVEACPVEIEHIDKIVELRRERVLMESAFPNELNATFRGMENNFNPWGIGFDQRADWAEDLDVGSYAGDEKPEYLWFVGCAASFDDRAKKVSKSLAAILKAANVSFGILGAEEKCCGETARRLGNEYLAQTLMEMNVEQFQDLGVKKIITTCPHCYNTLKNEYAQFGGAYEVIHHDELIAQLIRDGRIKLKSSGNGRMTLHDSCYLGRYAGIYDEPRTILQETGNSELLEVKDKNRERSMCCGAGGGRMWLDETIGKRINHIRLEQLADTGAETVVSTCPYCLTMFSDGIKEKEKVDELKVLDIAEIVEKAMVV
jgi:Fe-S oxidoreductase/nitrate reductase gamma subunit